MSASTKNITKAPSPLHEECSPVLLLRPRDVAVLLAISIRGVWRLAAKGEIPRPVKVGNSTRWRASDVEAFIAQSEVTRESGMPSRS